MKAFGLGGHAHLMEVHVIVLAWHFGWVGRWVGGRGGGVIVFGKDHHG